MKAPTSECDSYRGVSASIVPGSRLAQREIALHSAARSSSGETLHQSSTSGSETTVASDVDPDALRAAAEENIRRGYGFVKLASNDATLALLDEIERLRDEVKEMTRRWNRARDHAERVEAEQREADAHIAETNLGHRWVAAETPALIAAAIRGGDPRG